MTQPMVFHLQVAPSVTHVKSSTTRSEVQVNPLARTIIAAVRGIQGERGPAGDGAQVFGEAPAGVKNGTNAVFTTTHAFMAGTTAVYTNGLRERLGVSYFETGASQITYHEAPLPTDVISTDYVIS